MHCIVSICHQTPYWSFGKFANPWYRNMSLIRRRCNAKYRSRLMKHCSCNNPPWFHQMLWLAKMCILLIQTQFDLLINCNRLSSHYICNWNCVNPLFEQLLGCDWQHINLSSSSQWKSFFPPEFNQTQY